MGNENHREYKKKKISEPMIVNQNHWSWNLVLFDCFCILDGFRYPLVLKSWFSLLFVYSRWFWLPIGSEILVFFVVCVFSMVLATHWFWNLGFLGFVGILYGFGYPLILESWLFWFYPWFLVTHWSFLINMCMLKVLFCHRETTHKVENLYTA